MTTFICSCKGDFPYHIVLQTEICLCDLLLHNFQKKTLYKNLFERNLWSQGPSLIYLIKEDETFWTEVIVSSINLVSNIKTSNFHCILFDCDCTNNLSRQNDEAMRMI